MDSLLTLRLHLTPFIASCDLSRFCCTCKKLNSILQASLLAQTYVSQTTVATFSTEKKEMVKKFIAREHIYFPKNIQELVWDPMETFNYETLTTLSKLRFLALLWRDRSANILSLHLVSLRGLQMHMTYTFTILPNVLSCSNLEYIGAVHFNVYLTNLLTSLRHIHLDKCNIHDGSILSDLTTVEFLELEHVAIYNCSPVKLKPNIKILILRHVHVNVEKNLYFDCSHLIELVHAQCNIEILFCPRPNLQKLSIGTTSHLYTNERLLLDRILWQCSQLCHLEIYFKIDFVNFSCFIDRTI